ncbi:MAG: response regulator [Acidihalobacter sp.]
MADNKLLRPLIVDPDLNRAEELISAIKSAGYAVRPFSSTAGEDLDEEIKRNSPDLIVIALDEVGLDLPALFGQIEAAGRHIPVIALLKEPPADISPYLAEGAEDVIATTNRNHFQHVVKRTATAQTNWRQLKRAEAAVREAEKRCQTLLTSSKDAIAYVTDGIRYRRHAADGSGGARRSRAHEDLPPQLRARGGGRTEPAGQPGNGQRRALRSGTRLQPGNHRWRGLHPDRHPAAGRRQGAGKADQLP